MAKKHQLTAKAPKKAPHARVAATKTHKPGVPAARPKKAAVKKIRVVRKAKH